MIQSPYFHQCDPFSILYRIEWVVTAGWGQAAVGAGGFQYPVSDRMGCNIVFGQLADEVGDFQYPVSDRMGCN